MMEEYTSDILTIKFMNECYEKTAKNRNVVKITGYFRDPNRRYENIPIETFLFIDT
jgi:hypothetical protein